MKIKDKQLILEYDTELIALEIMLEDLPYFLSLDKVNLSPMCDEQRKEMLKKIKIIFKKIKSQKHK